MIKEIKDFKRIELFNHYHKGINPFIIITTKINVTNVVNYCKIHKNFYATLGFLITRTTNQIDVFKYRYKNKKFYYCEEILSGYTQILGDNNVAFFTVPFSDDFYKYKEEFISNKESLLTNNNISTENKLNEIWLSCIPWFSYSGLIPPFNKEITIPQFIWDKYENINDEFFVNLTIVVHHGFADGYHISKFINLLEENIKSLV